MSFTNLVHRFIADVCEGVSAEDAYRRHFDCSKLKDRSVYTKARALRNRPDVLEEIQHRQNEAAKASIKSVTDVANEFLRIAFADPGRIVQHRRLCCRHCHGIDHKYQWRDSDEYEDALRIWQEADEKRDEKTPPRPMPSDAGGYGFAFNRSPNAACPRCQGEGKPDVFITDTTKLSIEDRRLIERVRVTKDGIEIRFRNQSDALTKAGQMLGGFKSTVVLQNPDGTNVNAAPLLLPLSPEDAATKYKEWMDAGKTE